MNNKEDIYKEHLKSLFSDFETIIPEGSWNKIENSLNEKKRSAIIRRNWYIGSVAAIALVLITGTLFLNTYKDLDNTQTRTAEAISNSTNDSEKVNLRDNNQDSDYHDTRLKKNNIQHLVYTIQTKKSNQKAEILEYIMSSEEPYKFEEPTHYDGNNNSNQLDNQDKISQEEINRLIKDLQEAGNINLFAEEESVISKKNKPIRMALNARGGLTPSQHIANSPMTLRSSSSESSGNEVQNKTNNLMYSSTADNLNTILMNKAVSRNKAEMIHSQPIGVSITFSKRIIDRIYIESGISYSYLYSKSTNSSTVYINQETQHLHYLGIPINLNYNFVDLGKLSLFASIGGMIEKDLYGKYGSYKGIDQGISDAINNKSQEYQYDRITLKKPQFSINAGFGASYPIYKGLNLYAKIGGAYYFEAENIDKNNYKYNTIYSDKKIMLDLNAGIRFDFK